MFDSKEKLKEVIDSDKLEVTFALNLLINAALSNWSNLSKVDKYLLGKALETIKYYSDRKEDIVINFSKT
jgi:hypothetical protein